MSYMPNNRPKLVDLQKRIMGDVKPFHTSIYANVAGGERMGSASHETFAARVHTERSRHSIRRYRDAAIVNGSDREHSQRLEVGEPRESQMPAPRQSFNAMPRPAFHEPRTRGFNPYA